MYEVNSNGPICTDQCRIFRKILFGLYQLSFSSPRQNHNNQYRTKECNNRVKTTVSPFFHRSKWDSRLGGGISEPKSFRSEIILYSPYLSLLLSSFSLFLRVRVFACVTVISNIFGEYFKFVRTVPVLVPMHRIAPHYCIVALECLISCLGARTKRVITWQRDWSTYNSELFIFASARRVYLASKFYVSIYKRIARRETCADFFFFCFCKSREKKEIYNPL